VIRKSPMAVALLVCASCAGPEMLQEPVAEPAMGSGQVVVRFASGPEALDRFSPVRDPHLEDGECAVRAAHIPGAHTLWAHFPSANAAETSIAVTVDADGWVLRFLETRSAEPFGRSVDERRKLEGVPRTVIQLDYTTGEALAMNLGLSEGPNVGVRGHVLDFEQAAVLGDLPGRTEMVLEFCRIMR
jgi:hypothetical protein